MRCSPTRAWLTGTLVVWLLLAVAREVFDLIGRLWLPVTFNVFQILSCISGLFSAWKTRLGLLVTLTLSCVISFAYNLFIIMWYYDVLGVHQPRLLSFGLPYGQSFFVQHTPGCDSYFNLTSSQWNQRPCSFPFYNAESVQSVIHILLSIMTMIFSTFLFCETYARRNEVRAKKTRTVVECAKTTVRPRAECKAAPSDTLSSYQHSPDSLIEDGYSPAGIEKKVNDFHDLTKLVSKAKQAKSSPTPALSDKTETSAASSERLTPQEKPYSVLRTRSERPSTGRSSVAARLANHSDDYTERSKHSTVSGGGNLTELISFDPKADDDDILRVHEHHNDSDEDFNGPDYSAFQDIRKSVRRTLSNDSIPSFKAPVLANSTPLSGAKARGRSDFYLDSGHPSSATNDSEQTTEFPASPPPLPCPAYGRAHALAADHAQLYPCTSFSASPPHPHRQLSLATEMPLLRQRVAVVPPAFVAPPPPPFPPRLERLERQPSDELPPPPPALHPMLRRSMPRLPDTTGLLV